MLGSPSFHSYRENSDGSGRTNLEVGSGFYYEDQPYSAGQYWPNRAPVRRALIPTKRNACTDRKEPTSNSANVGKTMPSDTDDRIHNALLEELCADFGVTDSSYMDFLSFDLPTDRLQLPSDLEELGEIVTFDSGKYQQEKQCDASQGQRESNAVPLTPVGSRVASVNATRTSEIQMNIPDAVASPTISSSCEEGKPAEGGGEALSDLPPTVHSTTGSASMKPGADTCESNEDNLTQRPVVIEPPLDAECEREIVKHAAGELNSRGTSPSKEPAVVASKTDGSESSSSSSPGHVAKKPRLIESGGDLLEDVKKSYAFVCGADMFAAPVRPIMSHPRLHTPVGSLSESPMYSQGAPVYGTTTFDRFRNTYPIQNPNMQLQVASDKDYANGPVGSSQQYGSFGSSTPVKGFHQQHYTDWPNAQQSGFYNSRQDTGIQHASVMNGDPCNFQANTRQYFRGQSTNFAQYPTRSMEFPGYVDRSSLNNTSVNHSPRSVVHQSDRYYAMGAHSGSGQPAGGQPAPKANEYYGNPPGSPYRDMPAKTDFRHGNVAANESGNRYSNMQGYPAVAATANTANIAVYGEHVGTFGSPSRFPNRPQTPEFASWDRLLPGMENNLTVNNGGNHRYTGQGTATAAGPQIPQMMESSLKRPTVPPGTMSFRDLSTSSELSSTPALSGGNRYVEQRYPGTPIHDRSTGNRMASNDVPLPTVNQPCAPSNSVEAVPGPEYGCYSFVRHLIGSGSGPYRSHPLFPLLRDLVIADMNFEAPSFPYPLIAGLPKSFDRLIANYFSCTAHTASAASVDPSVDRIVMDALRYAHSALLDKIERRRLKEGHHRADVPTSPVDSVCSQISRIGAQRNQEGYTGPRVDPPQNSSAVPACMTDLGYRPPSACIETVPPSPRHVTSRYPCLDDSPASVRGPQYTVLSPLSAARNSRILPHTAYLPPQYSYGDLTLGAEKANRSKVLPNEAKAIMTAWLREHQDNPYPNDDEKEALMESTKLTINQINYWFTNARRRLLPKWSMIRRNAEEIQLGCNSPVAATP